MPKKQNYVLVALEAVAKAQQELNAKVDKHEKIIESQGQDIARLEKQVMQLRNQAIQAEIASGERTDATAAKYGVSSSRVAQIAPRKEFHRPKPN
ncbi:MAG: hypothetical protein CTR55_27135 [Pseudomonas sp.]|jgi:soluble P-type ATPase|uniref:hypothetical protein n=1 Tax=Pseudomonas sp. TaxID=306 RepID=UPI000CADEFA2|nr:hypothetical protein [Pseudomonas sp.]PJI45909.1 MAG: hypothetical protein CTR55_27135 [Pseudomonas sp.]